MTGASLISLTLRVTVWLVVSLTGVGGRYGDGVTVLGFVIQGIRCADLTAIGVNGKTTGGIGDRISPAVAGIRIRGRDGADKGARRQVLVDAVAGESRH